jgi:hypothetical protein
MRHRLWTLLFIPFVLGAAESHAIAAKKSPPRRASGSLARVVPPRPYELSFAAGEAAARSPDGKYSFQVVGDDRKKQFVLVRQRGVKRPIARIDLSQAHNLVVRFVGGHNLLAAWSAGTYCDGADLYSPRGEKLASFGLGGNEVSPDGTLAVNFAAFDEPGRIPDVADVIDLRSGKKLVSSKQAGIWNTCGARWENRRVTLVPCDAQTQPVVLALPSPGARARKK